MKFLFFQKKGGKPVESARNLRTQERPAELSAAVANAFAKAEVEGLIARLSLPIQLVVKMLRQVVLEVAPDAREELQHGVPTYLANGVFARIEPSEREVLVHFLKGGQLPSATELQGQGESRRLAFDTVDELKATVLRKVVREALMLNLQSSSAIRHRGDVE